MPVPSDPEPVAAPPLRREEVESRLRSAIVRGELAPGERLPEDDLAAWLGVSRTPIREALGRLAALGLVEIDPNRGAHVAPLNPAETEDLVEVAQALVGLLRQLVKERATADDLAGLAQLQLARQAYLAAGDEVAAEASLWEIHERLLHLARNRELERIYPSISLRLERLVRLAYNGDVASLGVDADMEMVTSLDGRDPRTPLEPSLIGWHDVDGGARALALALRLGSPPGGGPEDADGAAE